jgi:putative SOS response-associated peptidase YedK
MCGRYTLRQVSELQGRFLIDEMDNEITPRYNAAPSQMLPIIVREDSINRLQWMKWGLVPSWAKEPNPSYATINARAENLVQRPAFRKPLQNQRCIVPADGFYEWVAEGKKKQPYFIHMRDDSLFGMAGLYDRYIQPDGEILWSFTIITTSANSIVGALHSRMDVILDPANEDFWLDPNITDPKLLQPLFQPYTDEVMETYPVRTLVNSPANDRPELLTPLQRTRQSPKHITQESLFAL